MELNVAPQTEPLAQRKKFLPLVALIAASVVFYFYRLSNVPLVESDEASYARIVMSSLSNGSPLDFTFEGQPVLNRPPLYLWLAMGSVAMLGEQELAFRLPGVLLGVVDVVLAWAIAYRLSGRASVAMLAGLTLLVSPLMYGYVREVRLDTGLIAAMLATLLGVIAGWRQPRWLRLVLPAMAVGFLFKSVAVVLAVPVIAVYCLAYRQWGWLRRRDLWVGGVIAAAIALPWPFLQYLRHGTNFFQSFFVHDVWLRATEGFGNRPRGAADYLLVLWQFNQPWTALAALLMALLGFLAFRRVRRQLQWRQLLAPLGAVLAIIVLFTVAKTRVPTYILPAIPFAAMFLAETMVQLYRAVHPRYRQALAVAAMACLVLGAVFSRRIVGQLVNPFHYDQREIGRWLRENRDPHLPLYLVNWPYHSAIRYYGNTDLISLMLPQSSGRSLPAPFYLVLGPTVDLTFGSQRDSPELARRGLRVLFRGPYLRMFQGAADLTLPYPQDDSAR